MKGLIPALAVALLLYACSGGGATGDAVAVPKPYGYPRFAAYPDSSVSIEVGKVSFLVNASASAAVDGTQLDIAYPAYGTTVMLSVTENATPGDIAEAVANRHQRIALNLGGRSARTDRFVNDAGFECELVVSRDVPLTPVQFLAVGKDGTVVSGAAVMNAAGSADSIAPVVDALERDMFTLLKSIRR